MTNVTFIKDEQGLYIGFIVEGHSGYAEHGKDIVCAGISMLAQSMIFGIADKVHASSMVEINKNKPILSILTMNNDLQEVKLVDLLISIMYSSCKDVERQYDQYVLVKTVDVCSSKYAKQYEAFKNGEVK